MSYMALYRAWRPQSFNEVVGQEKTVIALQNALKQNRLTHAYLFSGPRGTGKTSIAKIVAKAVNCLDLSNGEPCNQCVSCTDINQGSFMDVIEIDAASNRGIDEIRDLREKVRMLPAQGKKKVYIIDEVHMLTTEAFNALLKTLEEPPESVVFILATTESQKIPATILSRCQSYHFRRLTTEEIVERLEQVASSKAIEAAPDALQLIARRANGGLRDALSTLDQIYSYKGQSIEKSDVLDVLGLVDDIYLGRLMEAVFTGDVAGVIEMLGQALQQGKEAQQLAREGVLYLRDLLVYALLGNDADLAVVTEVGAPLVARQAAMLDQRLIMKTLHALMAGGDRLRFSEGNRFQLEVTFLELIALAGSPDVKEAPPQPTPVKRTPKGAPAKEKIEKSGDQPALWNRILAAVKERKIPTHALLAQGKLLDTGSGQITIGYKKAYKFHKEKMEEPANKAILEEAVKEVLGQPSTIKLVFLDEDASLDPVVQKAMELFGEDQVEIKD